jgi:membrane-associated phospholipid phosphatase
MEMWAKRLMAGVLWLLLVTVCSQRAVYAGNARLQQGNDAAQDDGDGVRKTAKDTTGNDAPKTATKSGKVESDSERTSRGGLKGLGKDLLKDQQQIWTSPAQLRFSDANWLVPVGGFAAGLFATDRDVSRHLSNDPLTISHYKTMSTAGVAALVGAAGGMWLLSFPAHREHWRETGFLAGEAAINSTLAVEALKYSLRRERPYQGDGSGPFFQSGGTSFPSEHAAAAWSVAGVIAHEYPGLLPKIAAYGLASLVSYSRIRGRQHFPSDVFIGQMMGQMIAQDIYSRRHDPELGGGEWRSLSALARGWESAGTQNLGTPYVPLDSWVYPALDRLAAMGLVDSGFTGMRPWTRRECMRQVIEAQDNLSGSDSDTSEGGQLVRMLEREFHPEMEATGDGTEGAAFRLESVYSRTEHISGSALTDGYTFGQTQFNDFGRPYGEGWSTVNGFSAYATRGPWVVYVRGEQESAPSIPAYSLATREAVATADEFPLPPGTAQPSVNRFRLLDTYVGLMLSNWEVTFGKQSLWWGPGNGGPLDFSNNSEPINMFRVNRTTPLKLPSILGWLGPLRTEFFLGQLAGQEFILSPNGFMGQFGQSLSPQPYINGQKISFKPTRNFEFGFFRTTIFGGPGYPLTFRTLGRSLFSTTNENAGVATKPGNRTSGLDFSYRLPRLRSWLSFYGDGYTDDQFSPIAYADRSAWHAGLYFSHLPALPKLDLRVEGAYTDVPGGGGSIAPGTFYFNGTWRSGYTNDGFLIGNWVGRGGQGAQAWTNYWFNGRSRVQFNFRHQKVSQKFVPNGGTVTDVGARGDYWVRPNVNVSAAVQYERWLFPVIQANTSTNVSATIQIMFQPQKALKYPAHGVVSALQDEGRR